MSGNQAGAALGSANGQRATPTLQDRVGNLNKRLEGALEAFASIEARLVPVTRYDVIEARSVPAPVGALKAVDSEPQSPLAQAVDSGEQLANMLIRRMQTVLDVLELQ